MKHIKIFEQFEDDPFGEESNNDNSFISGIIEKLIDGRLKYKWYRNGYQIYNDDEDYYIESLVISDINNKFIMYDRKNNTNHEIDESKIEQLKDAFFTSFSRSMP